MPLPPLLPVPEIHQRLQSIFPEGTVNRNFVIREMAAKTIFVMLYVGAVDGEDRWLRPDQVTRMSDTQATLSGDRDREDWSGVSMRPTSGDIEGKWYAANTREPIRDETLRGGLVRLGAVKEREGLATTSPLPRYALTPEFLALFDPSLTEQELARLIEEWQAANLSGGALARVAIIRLGAVAREGQVLVTFPNGETRNMEPGPSSVISKAVVEEFASRFLVEPGVIWLSESRNHVVARDDRLAQNIGLTIEPDKNLPDLILADLGPIEPLLVFVEVVATAGPVNEARQAALMTLAAEAGFSEAQVAFLTAYADRDDTAFKASISELAWRSFAWFMSEPDHIVLLHRGTDSERVQLSELMRL
ncbi:MAG: BsuBI/PstI family type II restriction endonuclease [Bryobacterales bacterium]|nr:BsuBI/PstI family type II restriction endonuclease [Bryobacterales bacterium]